MNTTEGLKALIWDRGSVPNPDKSGPPLHKYVILGIVLTTAPANFRGPGGQTFLAGPVADLTGALAQAPQYVWPHQMDASDALVELGRALPQTPV
jgi:hypothetical protein